MTRQEKIEKAKTKSKKRPTRMHYRSFSQHETFLFEDGKLAEYNCTRYRGNNISLTSEEKRLVASM